ncbi:OsmC family protein [candidate division KSB1 bacterium]|nr:OsmC family protein [candidate division KSB1 bacterium]
MRTKKLLLLGLLAVTLVVIGALIINTQGVASAGMGSQEKAVSVNGLNTVALGGLVDMLKGDAKAGRVTFFSNSKWQDGMRSLTSFTGYKIDGKLHHEKERQFVLLGDEGVELSGTDAAPGAVEELMYAVGTCIIAAGNANAALMGVKLTRFEIALESDIDLHGLFALDEKVRPGILEFRSKITIAGDADEETLRKIALLGYKYSPVSDTVRNGVSMAVEPEVVVVKGMTAK